MSNNQKKQCPSCSNLALQDNNFCMKCGFDFSKMPKPQQPNENEKECPECKLIQDKEASNCNNCGYPFTNKVVQSQERLQKSEVKPIHKTITETPVLIKKTNIGLYIVLAFVSLIIIAGLGFFYVKNKKEQELKAIRTADSLDKIQSKIIEDAKRTHHTDTTNNNVNADYTSGQNSNEKQQTTDIATVRVDRAYFYNSPNEETKRKSFILKGEKVQYDFAIENGFVKAIYTNKDGNKTEGWMMTEDFKELTYDENDGNQITDNRSASNNDEIFTVVEEMPTFQGGETEKEKFISNNLMYPQYEREAGISGKCYLKFIVEKDGSITNVQVLKGVGGGANCDKEAMRVVSLMPKWIAGKQGGMPVRVQINLPIQFSLR
jgi:TonB family protein